MIRTYTYDIAQWELVDFNNDINRDGGDIELYDKNGCLISEYNIPNYLKVGKRVGYKNLNFTIPIYQSLNVIGYYTDLETIERQFLLDGEENPYTKNPFLSKDSYLDNTIFEINGITDSKLDRFFNFTGGYDVGLNYNENPVEYFDGVLSQNAGVIEYVVGAKLDTNGLIIPQTGVYYITTFELATTINPFGFYEVTHKTSFKTWSYGRIDEAYSLNSFYHDDKNLGMIKKTDTNDNLEFERTTLSVFEPHFRLEELRTSTQIEKYQNNYFTFK